MTIEEVRELPVSRDLKTQEETIRQIFQGDSAFKLRHITSRNGENRYLIAYFDGMVNTQVVDLHIVRPLTLCDGNLTSITVGERVITVDVYQITGDYASACEAMVLGDTLIFMDGSDQIIAANTKGFLMRSITEPESEKNLRGPREGFNESIIANTTLLRRRMLSPDLKMEMMGVTTASTQKFCICYLDSLVDRNVLARLKKRLGKLQIRNLLSSNYIEEYIRDAGYSPFKTVGSTERPDIVAAKLLEGRVAIIIDGTPTVLTVPFLFLEYFQVGSDYNSNYWVGTIERLLRIAGVFLSISVPALYIALICFHQELLPVKLLVSIATARDGVPLSAVLELFVMLIAFELLREAGIMLPQGIGNALSTVGGVVIGQAAVEARFISAPLVIIVAFTGLTDMLAPKMREAMLLMRIYLLAMASVLGLYGYVLGMGLLLAILLTIRSFGIPYMAFLGTWRLRDLWDTGLRAPLWMLHMPSVREWEE